MEANPDSTDCRGMLTFRLSIALVAIFILSASTGALAAWQTTHFELFLGEPHLDRNTEGEDQRHLIDSAMVPDAVVAEIEQFLHEFAVQLEREGFTDPGPAETLGPLVTGEDGVRRFRVYMLDLAATYGSDKLGVLANRCDYPNWRYALLLNSKDTFSGARIKPRGYQTMVHELFHAVQYASAFRRIPTACAQGKWITEGTADAIGFDYARKLRNIDFDAWTVGAVNKPWGIRAYNDPLNARITGGDTAGYQTMSFWRHLAEWHYAKQNKQPHPGSEEAKTDYGYMATLFAKRPSAAGLDQELKWLNDWMKSSATMNAGLAPIYAQFVSSYAGYHKTRFHRLPSRVTSQWPMKPFDGCESVHLSSLEPASSLQLRIDSAASRCFTIQVDGEGYQPRLVLIDNGNLNQQMQEQLYIGAMGGQLVAAADVNIAVAPSKDAGRSFAKWEFLVAPGVKNYFIIANIGKRPQMTMNVRPELNLSVPEWNSSLTQKSTPPAAQGATGQPTTRKAVADYKRSLKQNPTTQSAGAAMSGSDPRPADPGCLPENLSRNLCGPQLVINLSKDYGMMPNQGPVSSTGGLLQQMQGSSVSGADELALAIQMQQTARNNKGNNINISIPYIDYGGGGSFGNALIEVSGNPVETDGGQMIDSYVSVRANPDGDGIYPPNGTVTIEQYTPHILKGSFSAELVARSDMQDPSVTRQNPQLPVSEHVSGSFTVAAPWRGNGARPDTSPDGAMMTGIRNDTMDILMKIPEPMRAAVGGSRLQELCKLGFEDSQLASLGITGSCSGGGPGALEAMVGCRCDCESWQSVQQLPGCRNECDPKWQAWRCGPYLETGLGELDGETTRYQAELQSLDFTDNAITSMTHTFKISSAPDRARMQQDLESYRQQQDNQDLNAQVAEIEAEQAQRGQNYDAETLRYKSALENAGYTEVEVSGMVEIFAPSPKEIRQVFWNSIETRVQN